MAVSPNSAAVVDGLYTLGIEMTGVKRSAHASGVVVLQKRRIMGGGQFLLLHRLVFQTPGQVAREWIVISTPRHPTIGLSLRFRRSRSHVWFTGKTYSEVLPTFDAPRWLESFSIPIPVAIDAQIPQ
jgi:hypothetical protein